LKDCLQFLFKSTAEGVYAVDEHGKCIFFNQKASDLTGWQKEEVLGTQIHEIIHRCRKNGTIYPQEECEMLGVLHKKSAVRIEEDICIRRDGTFFPADYSAWPIIKEEETLGAVVLITDITGRLNTEESLRRHAEGLSFLSNTATKLLKSSTLSDQFKTTADFLYSVAEDAIIAFNEFDPGNRTLTIRELRCTDNEREILRRILGRNVEGLVFNFTEATRGRMIPGKLDLLEGGLYDLTFRQIPRSICDTLERELNIGDVFAMACAVEDDLLGTATILSHACGGFLRNKNLIESIVNQAALSLKRTRIENELNIRLAESERFAYTFSHELRTPLVTLKSFLGYLHHDIKEQNQMSIRDDLNRMENAVVKMSDLFDDLLELMKAGRKRNPLEKVMLKDIVDEALKLEEEAIKRQNVTIKTSGENISLIVDFPGMVEVFQNLINNAIKFMGSQPNPEIKIGAIKKGEETILYVKDNGIGIEPQYQHKIFDLFEKFHPEIAGTGTGLAIVKRIVEHHHGRIWVESEGKGSGTAFYFTVGHTSFP